MDDKQKAEALKQEGNKALKGDRVEDAIQKYDEAIGLDPENHLIYSNRSFAYFKQKKYQKAIDDAEASVDIEPNFAKGYVRKGDALWQLQRYAEAEEAFKEALKIEPKSQDFKKRLEEVQAKRSEIPNPFEAGDVEEKLLASPKTKAFMEDPEFRRKLDDLAMDPQNLANHMNDQRVLIALAVLLDVNVPTEGDNSDPFVNDKDEFDWFASDSDEEEGKSKKKKAITSQEEGSQEEGPSTSQEEGPSTSQEEGPSTSQEEGPNTSQEEGPSVSQPEEQQEVGPVASESDSQQAAAPPSGSQQEDSSAGLQEQVPSVSREEEETRDDSELQQGAEGSVERPQEPPTERADEEDQSRKGKIGGLNRSPEQALEEKEKGNAAYKKKDFDTALAHYNRALELDPSNITFLTNKAAVYFEMSDWDQCLKLCEEAVERGREVRADFKLIAKAFARMGNTYVKQKKWEEAVKFFDKSLAEHRNPDIVAKQSEAKKKMVEQQRLDYIDLKKSLEEKEKGNEFFKKGKFPDAVKHYNEAIKRNPDDAKLYSNRAACYTKLLEFNLALKDCDDCIRLDPNFVKGYIRKGHVLLALKDTVKAMHAFQKALELDPHNADARSGLQRCYAQDNPEERRKRALQDPEVQAILGDPAMQLILQQMQSNPEALRDHIKNPDIAAKIEKLIEAGFIGLR